MQGEASSQISKICGHKNVRILYEPAKLGQWFDMKNGSMVTSTEEMHWLEIHPPSMEFEMMESFISFFHLTASFHEGGNVTVNMKKVSFY